MFAASFKHCCPPASFPPSGLNWINRLSSIRVTSFTVAATSVVLQSSPVFDVDRHLRWCPVIVHMGSFFLVFFVVCFSLLCCFCQVVISLTEFQNAFFCISLVPHSLCCHHELKYSYYANRRRNCKNPFVNSDSYFEIHKNILLLKTVVWLALNFSRRTRNLHISM